jgi:hypothetical protein
MYLRSVLKGLVVGSAVSLSLLLSQLSYAQEPSSFTSWNYPNRYIRHRLSLGYIDPIVARDSLGRKDATFRPVNFPQHYIRHSNFELWLAKSDGSQLFKKDATFIVSPPLTVHPPRGPIDPGTNQIPAPGE